MIAAAPARRPGCGPSAAPQDHVLRNHSVGRRCSRAASGPRLWTVDADQDVLGPCLGVLDEHVEVPIVVEDPRVDELVFELLPGRLRFVSTRSR
jgi:hypothetical protein